MDWLGWYSENAEIWRWTRPRGVEDGTKRPGTGTGAVTVGEIRRQTVQTKRKKERSAIEDNVTYRL